MKAFLPRIEIALSQIRHNAQVLSDLYGQQGISLMGVSKAVLGDPAIALAMIEGGVKFIADSRLENIQRMKKAGISSQFVLLRTVLSQAEAIVMNADVSLNTEIDTIAALSHYANLQNKIHQIIVMVELGDLREGILPENLSQFIKKVLTLPHLKVIGLGCNLACYGGIKPDNQKMQELSDLTDAIEKEFQIDLKVISGGNSANHEWYEAIPGMYTSAFKLVAEVIESKDKPSLPYGEACQDSFGNIPVFQDRGVCRRVILALGKQDTSISGLTPDRNFEILGSSSDHLILDSKNCDLKIGTEVDFNLDYGALLAAMTSPFIQKQFISLPL
jgi:ornithine racemase